MKSCFRCFLAAVICGLVWLIPTPLSAQDQQVYTDTIDLNLTDWTDTMQFPRFDPAVGVLTGVEFILDGRLRGSAQIESLEAEAVEVTISMSANIVLQRPNGLPIVESIPATSVTESVSAFDGTVDFAGGSGRVFPSLIGIHLVESGIFSEPADLAQFVGEGSITLPVSASGRASGEGGGNLALGYTTEASAFVTVTYFFENGSIDLEKWTNGEDADDAPGPFLILGEPVTWSYLVTNTGPIDLEGLIILDDQEGEVACPGTTLAAGASMVCTLVSTAGAQAGQYSNTATVTAQTRDDGVNPPRAVSDSDPSHYYGSKVPQCPLDNNGQFEVPLVQYLGHGSGVYVLPDGFDLFIVKRRDSGTLPFRFDLVEPTENASGERTIEIDQDPRSMQQRVWACVGDCGFVAHLDGSVDLGYLEPGITIGAVVIDDDDDHRINRWEVESNGARTEIPITEQLMVEYLTLDIPRPGQWSYYAADSVGIVHVCLMPEGSVWRTTQISSSNALTEAGDEAELLERMLFLPAIFGNRR
jgi:hypothetical protein